MFCSAVWYEAARVSKQNKFSHKILIIFKSFRESCYKTKIVNYSFEQWRGFNFYDSFGFLRKTFSEKKNFWKSCETAFFGDALH